MYQVFHLQNSYDCSRLGLCCTGMGNVCASGVERVIWNVGILFHPAMLEVALYPT